MYSHFFTDTYVKQYSKHIHDLLLEKHLLITNISGFNSYIIEPEYLASISTIGTRKSRKRKYDDDDVKNGGVGTPLLFDLTSTPDSLRSIKAKPNSKKSNSKKSNSKKSNSKKPKIKRIRFTLKTPREIEVKNLHDKKQKNLREIIDRLTEITCKGGINPIYGLDSVTKGLEHPEKYDIAIIADSNIRNNKKSFEEKLNYIYGMIIVQKGECKKYPDSYAINLICGKEKNMAKYLMGLYFYVIIKNDNLSKYGLLEVAGKYTNPNALCLYGKFGFVHSTNLIDDCFEKDNSLPSRENLPMIVDITQYTIEKLFDIIRDKTDLKLKHKLCSIKDEKLQKKIGIYLNIAYILKNQTDYSHLYKFLKDNERYISIMYTALNIKPDYMERGMFQPQKISSHIDGYIEKLYSENHI